MLGGTRAGGLPSSLGGVGGSPPQAGGQPRGWLTAQRPSGSLWFALARGWMEAAGRCLAVTHKFSPRSRHGRCCCCCVIKSTHTIPATLSWFGEARALRRRPPTHHLCLFRLPPLHLFLCFYPPHAPAPRPASLACPSRASGAARATARSPPLSRVPCGVAVGRSARACACVLPRSVLDTR